MLRMETRTTYVNLKLILFSYDLNVLMIFLRETTNTKFAKVHLKIFTLFCFLYMNLNINIKQAIDLHLKIAK